MSSNQEQIDDFMYRTFGYPPLRKAPAENLEGFTDAERQALTSGRFAMRTPPPAPPPPPATHEPGTPEEHEPGTPEEQREAIAEWMETHGDSMYSRRGGAYRAARPRQTRTGLRPHGADEEDTPMRSIRITRPSLFGTYGQPAITHKQDGPVLDNGREALRENEAIKETKQRLAAEHVKQGTLTDGTEFLNLGGLAKHQTDLIAKEYAKWYESGGGPLPDLSKYENPVARRKDGTKWDYRQTVDRLTRLHQRARGYDATHKEHFPALSASSNGNLDALDPQYIWSHIHEGVNPPKISGKKIDRTIFPDELKRTGLRPHQYPYQTRGLMNLGLHHQKLSQLHAEGADDE